MTATRPGMKTVTCGATITGPKVGRRVVAWRKQCRRKIRVPVDTPSWEARCHLHPRSR